MRRIILLFSLVGFALGAVIGFLGLSGDGSRSVEARTGDLAPTFHLSGIDGASQGVAETIEDALRRRLVRGGARVVDGPSACAIDLGARFTHEMAESNAVVTLQWLVRRQGGGEIARVTMQNVVPAQMLHGDWSNDAPHIARTVEEALIRIVADKSVPFC